MEFRNVAIIAHVDHGKTTLVDGLLRQCHTFQEHEAVADRVMDSMDLERERGITIASKNTAVMYDGVKINIMDTPGHADFGGEVERVLRMVDGALLLVDASEGPLPQTRFVLRKAMEAGLKIMVVVNKIDRPDARIGEVLDEIYDLFIELGADDEQLEFPVIYAWAKKGISHYVLGDDNTDFRPILDTIIQRMPSPKADALDSTSLLITNLDYDPYVGRLGLGRLYGKPMRKGDMVTWFGADGKVRRFRAQLLYTWMGLRRHEVEEVEVGDIMAVAGIDELTVGDTVAAGDSPVAQERITVDEPTIGMTFTINNSPFSGRDGKFLTGRQIRARLERELMSNVSLRMELTDQSEAFKVYGRGELQLAILIEQMRREGFELSVSRPEVVFKTLPDGRVLEPWEEVTIDIPDMYVGPVTQGMAARKGQMRDMIQDGSGHTRIVYRVPSRGLIGFRSELLTESRGEAVINALFDGWDEQAGFYRSRANGTIVSDREGATTTYALFHLQPRGTLFVGPGVDVYEGMVIGEHIRENDLNVNVVKGKQLTNIRSSGADEKLILSPPRVMSLDTAIEFIDEDEWVEVTPNHVRLRKKILPANQRSIIRSERK